MRQLPEILDQGNTGACVSYAIAGAANFQLANLKSKDRVDAAQLYEEETGNGGNTISDILAKCQIKGIPLVSGNILKLTSYRKLLPGSLNAINELMKGLPLVFTYQIGAGVGLYATPPDFTMQPSLLTHGMVLCDYENQTKRFYCANSWGNQWAKDGYFYMNGMDIRLPFCVELYTFTVSL